MDSEHSTELDLIESRIVWILGGPRTGSTWLESLLVHPLTPAVESISGAARREGPSAARPFAVPINEPYLGTHLAPIEMAGDHPLSVYTAADARQGDPSYFFDERYADVWRPVLRRLILERFGAQLERSAREHGLDRPLAVIKEPNGSQAAPILLATLPRSRLIFLLRDGRDVIDSLLDAFTPGGWLGGSPESAGLSVAGGRNAFVRRHASLWVHRIASVTLAAEAHPPELQMAVRYESLRADTPTVLSEIVAWLGVESSESAIAEAAAANSFEDYPAEAKGAGKPVRFASPGRWRQSLSLEEQESVNEIMGPWLRHFGYDS